MWRLCVVDVQHKRSGFAGRDNNSAILDNRQCCYASSRLLCLFTWKYARNLSRKKYSKWDCVPLPCLTRLNCFKVITQLNINRHGVPHHNVLNRCHGPGSIFKYQKTVLILLPRNRFEKPLQHLFMTGFKLMVTLQSGCVIEILTLCRIHEIFFQKYHEKAEIHSFPTMYIKGGSSFGRS